MAIAPNNESYFKPGYLYPIEAVANILDVSNEWVRKKLIYSGKCNYKKEGNVYLFRGEWLISWASDDFKVAGELESDGQK